MGRPRPLCVVLYRSAADGVDLAWHKGPDRCCIQRSCFAQPVDQRTWRERGGVYSNVTGRPLPPHLVEQKRGNCRRVVHYQRHGSWHPGAPDEGSGCSGRSRTVYARCGHLLIAAASQVMGPCSAEGNITQDLSAFRCWPKLYDRQKLFRGSGEAFWDPFPVSPAPPADGAGQDDDFMRMASLVWMAATLAHIWIVYLMARARPVRKTTLA
jgi:hypothetical protein